MVVAVTPIAATANSVTLASRWFYGSTPNLAVEVRAMTPKMRSRNGWLVLLAMLMATSAWAGPCIICAGNGGGWGPSDGAVPAAVEPSAQVVVCIPCRGEPYFIP